MSGATIEVVEAEPEHVPALAGMHYRHLLFHEAFDPAYRPQAIQTYEATYRDLLDDPSSGVLVALADVGPAGFCTLRLHTEPGQTSSPGWRNFWRRRLVTARAATLVDFFVEEQWRRHRVGTELFDGALAWLREHHVQEVRLGVMAGNSAGRAFWTRQGFTEYRITLRRRVATRSA